MTKVLENINELGKDIPVCLTIGTMDGVHTGHRLILERMNSVCKRIQCKTLLVTFHPHPRKVIRNESVELITEFEEKISLFNYFGMPDYVLPFRFTKDFASLSPLEFLELLTSALNIKCFVVGYDNHFGKNREGNYDFLAEFSRRNNITLHRVDAFEINNRPVSSTLIRTLLKEGKIPEANKMLGYDYFVTGNVTGGKGLGRTLGFPTANISVGEDKLLPALGVYAAYVCIDGKYYPAAVNVGFNPTTDKFARITPSFEVHIPGFSGDLYGVRLRVHLIERIREEKQFPSPEQLAKAIESDVEMSKKIFDTHSKVCVPV